MPVSISFPLVDVAVVMVVSRDGSKLLADYNAQWGAFTLPMAKSDDPSSPRAAAVRACVEVLGMPLPPSRCPVRLEFDVPVYQESGRDGDVKRYRYIPFVLRADAEPHPLPGHAAVWLTPAELESHEPVSPSVRHLLSAIPFAEARRAAGF
jgi:hypothetical protein